MAMDETHLVAALRYVALNPVRAKLCSLAEDSGWSSVRAHFSGEDDGIVEVAPALDRIGDYAAFLDESFDEAFTMRLCARRKAWDDP